MEETLFINEVPTVYFINKSKLNRLVNIYQNYQQIQQNII